MLQARRISSRRLVIHVPVKVKTHHHTHTVYKVLHGSGAGGGGSGIKQTVYKIVGFSGEGGGGHGDMGHGSHSPGHSHSQSHSQSHGMGMGEITYEDRHGCESGKVMPSHRDIFNHYARHDQEAAEDSDYAEERDEFIDVRDAWLWIKSCEKRCRLIIKFQQPKKLYSTINRASERQREGRCICMRLKVITKLLKPCRHPCPCPTPPPPPPTSHSSSCCSLSSSGNGRNASYEVVS